VGKQPSIKQILGTDLISKIEADISAAKIDLFDEAMKVVETHLSTSYFPGLSFSPLPCKKKKKILR
jgi:hypothetical protein